MYVLYKIFTIKRALNHYDLKPTIKGGMIYFNVYPPMIKDITISLFPDWAVTSKLNYKEGT